MSQMRYLASVTFMAGRYIRGRLGLIREQIRLSCQHRFAYYEVNLWMC